MSGADRDLTPLAPIGHGQDPVRPGARAAPGLRRPAAARATPAAPRARTSRPGSPWSRPATTRAPGAQLTVDNPFPAIHGRVCYHPCEAACNRLELDGAVSIHGVERFLGDLAIEHGWAFDPPPARTGRRVLVIGSGPSGLAAAYHLARLGHEVTVRDSGSEPGGMMRYGIPSYRLPRDVLDAEIDRLRALGVIFEQDHRVVDLAGRDARRRLRRGRSSRSAPTCPPGSTSPTRTPRASSTPSSFLRGAASGTQAPLDRPGRGLRRRQHGHGCRPRRPPARRRRHGHRLPPHPRADARPRVRGRRTPRRRASGSTGCAPSARWARTTSPSRSRSSTRTAGRTAPAGSRRSRPTRSSSRSARRATPASCTASPASSSSGDTVQVDQATLMTGAPGIFAGGDAVPSERTVTVGVGHGKRAARAIDAWLRGAAPTRTRPSTRWRAFDKLNLWYFGDARPQRAGRPRPGDPGADLRRGAHRALARRGGASRPAAACPAATASSATAASAPAPRTPSIKLGVGLRYRFDYDKCTGCGACYRQCPVHAIEMVAEV